MSSMTSSESSASVKAASWALQRRKNLVTLGAWEDCAFHVSLRNKDKAEDPLEVPLFSDAFPYHCLPHCGVYGADEYSIALPLAIITLPGEEITSRARLFSAMPPEVQAALDKMPRRDPNLVSVAILIHSLPNFLVSLEPHQRELNILYHMWALQGSPHICCGWPAPCQDEAHTTVEMGVFVPEGVCETAQEICEELNGMPVGRLGPRILYMHELRLSPHNAQLKLFGNVSLHTFFAVAQNNDGRVVVTYHAVPSTQECEKMLKCALSASHTVSDLITHMDSCALQLSGTIARLVGALDK